MALKLVSVLANDYNSLFADIRKHDFVEWEAGIGPNVPVDYALHLAFSHPAARGVLNEDGKCIAAWGVWHTPPDAPHVGRGWLVATNEGQRRVWEIHRYWLGEINTYHRKFPTITALSHIDNAMHHTWMQAVGFKFVEAQKLNGEYFLLFRREKS